MTDATPPAALIILALIALWLFVRHYSTSVCPHGHGEESCIECQQDDVIWATQPR